MRRRGISHVLSILDPGSPVPPEIGALGAPRRLELRFHDVIEDMPEVTPANPEHVARLLAFGRELATKPSGDPHLLIHCHAGFSRSPAALALLLAQAQPRSLPRVRRSCCSSAKSGCGRQSAAAG
jgi:predicted protein tyrosine phosphatase